MHHGPMTGSDKDCLPTNALRQSLRRKSARGPLDPERAAQLLLMPTRRAARPLPVIGKKVLNLVRPMLRGRGASLGEITMRWGELAGPRLALMCKPEKLSRSREGTVLTIIARGGPGAALAELESEILMARLNTAFGRNFIGRLRIRQGRISSFSQTAKPAPSLSGPTIAARNTLEAKLAKLPAGPLRDEMRQLGLALLARGAQSN